MQCVKSLISSTTSTPSTPTPSTPREWTQSTDPTISAVIWTNCGNTPIKWSIFNYFIMTSIHGTEMFIVHLWSLSFILRPVQNTNEKHPKFQPAPPSSRRRRSHKLETEMAESQSLSEQILNHQFQSLKLDKQYEVLRQRVVTLLYEGGSLSDGKHPVTADPAKHPEDHNRKEDAVDGGLQAMAEVRRQMHAIKESLVYALQQKEALDKHIEGKLGRFKDGNVVRLHRLPTRLSRRLDSMPTTKEEARKSITEELRDRPPSPGNTPWPSSYGKLSESSPSPVPSPPPSPVMSKHSLSVIEITNNE